MNDLFPEIIGKGSKNWGMPYMGSKNDIAWDVVHAMPKADVFVDLFCGGCAITHAAMVSNRWKRFVMNDIKPIAKIFYKAVHGDLKKYERFVPRHEFMKTDDLLIKMIWSFGNDCNSYLWSTEKEKLKGAAVRMLTEKTLKKRRAAWRDFVRELKTAIGYEELKKEKFNQLQRLERLQSLERLERLERLESLESLESHQDDYKNIHIPDNAVVYCDIPYKGTSDYGNEFNHEEFYEWFKSLKVPAFMSEYSAPFQQVAEWPKRKKRGNPATMKGNNLGSCTERLYFNGTLEQYKELMNA